MNKVYPNPDETIADLKDGASIMVGGFGLCRIPEKLIDEVCRKGVDATIGDASWRCKKC